MYLGELNDVEKSNFLELVYKAGNADQSFSKMEIKILSRFKAELGISKIPTTSTKEELIEYFAGRPVQTQKIVLFEIFGMLLVDDGHISDEEKVFVKEIVEKFSLDKETVKGLRLAAFDLEKAYFYARKAVFN